MISSLFGPIFASRRQKQLRPLSIDEQKSIEVWGIKLVAG